MNSRTRRWAMTLTVALGFTPAATGQLIHSVTIPAQAPPWTSSAQIPAFDRALGRLDGISLFVSGSISGTLRLENTTNVQVAPSTQPRAHFNVLFPSIVAAPAPFVSHSAGSLGLLAPYDGTTDFTGASGLAQVFGPTIGSGAFGGNYRPDLDLLCVPPGASGMNTVTVSATDTTPPPSPAGVMSGTTFDVGVTITVFYNYTPAPSVLCDQPQVSACPCGNHGSSGRGCANSVQSAGGRLQVSGTASIGADSLTLSGSFMTNSSVLYFQGTDYTLSGTAFGDGRRCVTGSVRRLGTKTNAGGASQYPVGGDAAISVQGQVTTPGIRTYQAYYRDLGAFCTPAGFNVTNAYLVTWSL